MTSSRLIWCYCSKWNAAHQGSRVAAFQANIREMERVEQEPTKVIVAWTAWAT